MVHAPLTGLRDAQPFRKTGTPAHVPLGCPVFDETHA